MADFGTSFPSRFADLLAKYTGADGATTSAQIVVSGSDSTSIDLHMSASEVDGQTVLSTQAEAVIDGVTLSATADATGEDGSGEAASTSLDLSADAQDGVVEAKVTADATGAGSTAATDATVGPEVTIIDFQQVETPGDNTAESFLEATFESLPSLQDIALTTDTSLTADSALTGDAILTAEAAPTLIDTVTADDWW